MPRFRRITCQGAAFRTVAGVSNGGDLDTGFQQVQGGAVSFRIGSQDDGFVAGFDGIACDQPLGSTGQQHAREVVVMEHGRLLEHAGGEHGSYGFGF